MKSFGRRDFVGWRGTKSDAVQAPSAFRDPARAQKTKSKRLQFHLSSAGVFLNRLGGLFRSGCVEILAR